MSSPSGSPITSVLKETRQFAPPKEFQPVHIKSLEEYEKLWQRGKEDPEGFWGEQASQSIVTRRLPRRRGRDDTPAKSRANRPGASC